MRSRGINIPVLMLTAKAEVDDRVEGLDAGADDYLPKPFAMKELLARVNAMTRRKTKYSGSFVTYADFSLNTETLDWNMSGGGTTLPMTVQCICTSSISIESFRESALRQRSQENAAEHMCSCQNSTADICP